MLNDLIDIENAVENLDLTFLLEIIEKEMQNAHNLMIPNELASSIFHKSVDATMKHADQPRLSAQMVYLLRNIGANINQKDKHGCTPLLRYLSTGAPNPDVVEAFLRCNADVYIADQEGVYPLEVVTNSTWLSPEVKDIFMKYVPGIWEAVEGDDSLNVRKLINEWCRVDLQKNNQSLLQLALEKGSESIIRVVSGIRPSMEFSHYVLAGDIASAKKMLRVSQKTKLNINFRNLGDKGRTPLYYALLQGSAPMVRLLLQFAARVDINLKGDAENDVPLYIAALQARPPLSSELLKIITPIGPGVTIDSIFYQGRNVLFHCVDNSTPRCVVEYILQNGPVCLVTQCIQKNLCARDYAILHRCEEVVSAIDRVVVRWMLYDGDSVHRETLILHGYKYIPAFIAKPVLKSDSAMEDFYHVLSLYREQVNRVHEAVEECDVEAARRLLYFHHGGQHGLHPCLAECRRHGDGQPLLHKAALRQSYELLGLLAETLVYEQKRRLDSIRDQSFRSALHYLCGQMDGKRCAELLMDYGASEFSMDKDGRSPLCFKHRQGHTLMLNLLDYQLRQDLQHPEPDPWSVPVTVPIINYILSSENAAHLKDSDSSSALQCRQGELRRHCSSSDTKLHKLMRSASMFSHLSAIPGILRSSKMASHLNGQHRTADYASVDGYRDYMPVPTTDTYDDCDDRQDVCGSSDGRDLLEACRIKSSPSCIVQ